MNAFTESPVDRIYLALSEVCDDRDRDPDVPGHDDDPHHRPFWAIADTIAVLLGDDELTGLWTAMEGDALERNYRAYAFTPTSLVLGYLTMLASEDSSEVVLPPSNVRAIRRRLSDIVSVEVVSSTEIQRTLARAEGAVYSERSVRVHFGDDESIDLLPHEWERREGKGVSEILAVLRAAGV